MNITITKSETRKEDEFFDSEKRDRIVAELRKKGWKVRTGCYVDWDMNEADAASGYIYWYKAIREVTSVRI